MSFKLKSKYYLFGLLIVFDMICMSSCFTISKTIHIDVPITSILKKDTIALGYIENTQINLSNNLTYYIEQMLRQCDNLHIVPAKKVDSLLQHHKIYGTPREVSPAYLYDLKNALKYRYFLRSALLQWQDPKLDIDVAGAKVGLMFQLYDLLEGKVVWQCRAYEESSVWGEGSNKGSFSFSRSTTSQFLFLIRDIFNRNKGFCNWIKPKQ